MIKSILLALSLLPSVPAERELPEKEAQMTALAAALVEYGKDPDTIAFLVAWGSAESNFSLRIQRNECRRWECDRGKARGPFQVHRNGKSAEAWDRMVGVENTRAQVEQAARHARWALSACRLKGDARIVSAFRVLGGVGCAYPLKGEADRLERFRKARAAL
jgi:hypothetical protein